MTKYEVCPECEGEGYVGTLGAYTVSEFAYEFEDADEYHALNEVSKEACQCCKGQRVVTVEQIEEHAERMAYEAERAAESRYCGYY